MRNSGSNTLDPPNARLPRFPRSLGMAVLGVMLLTACSGLGTGTETSALTSSEQAVTALGAGKARVTVVAAGDIARTPTDGVETGALIRSIAPDAVLALGDTAYESGTPQEFMDNYDPTWGEFKEITRPIPGNHEYETDGASGYFDYFRGQVHNRPYYAWYAGRWRMYALNCEVDCGRSSEQVDWLKADLVKHAGTPSLAYVHEPFLTCSTRHQPARRLDDIWSALDDADGQVLLSANNHAYERFRPVDAARRESRDGLRQFVVGTGGAAFYPLVSPCRHRQAQSDTAQGVLRLELTRRSYSWEFLATDGSTIDSGRTAVTLR